MHTISKLYDRCILFITLYIQKCLTSNKVKKSFSYSATLWHLTCHGLGIRRETTPFESPWENFSFMVCVQPTYDSYGAQEYQTCTDTAFSWYQFTRWSSGASEIHFLCSEIHVRPVQDSKPEIERATTEPTRRVNISVIRIQCSAFDFILLFISI